MFIAEAQKTEMISSIASSTPKVVEILYNLIMRNAVASATLIAVRVALRGHADVCTGQTRQEAVWEKLVEAATFLCCACCSFKRWFLGHGATLRLAKKLSLLTNIELRHTPSNLVL